MLFQHSTRKNIRKTKDKSSSLKKEIVRLRHYFQNINLHNQVILKDYQRRTRNNISNQKNTLENKKHSFKRNKNEKVFNEIQLGTHNTKILENKSRSKQPKVNMLHSQEKSTSQINLDKSEALKVDSNILQPEKCLHIPHNTCNSSKEEMYQHEEPVPQFNEYKHDLQSLLLMMTNYTNTEVDPAASSELICRTSTPNYQVVENKEIENYYSDGHESRTNTDIITSQPLLSFLSIMPIKSNFIYGQTYLEKKYFIKWKSLTISKVQNRNMEQRQKTLNHFFNKLSKKINNSSSTPELAEKAKILARDYNTYQHRYKVQKHIIALQKAKLEEQNKLIEELKYNNIVEISRQSLDSIREDVQKTYYEIDRHLKPKIKCLTNELKIKEFEEPSLVLHCLKVPQFLQRMEARAREREEKHAIIKERRIQMEEERRRMKQQVELVKAEMDKEEKAQRIKELRQKRKKEKIENIRKKQHAERMRALFVMADLHYERNLIHKYGIRPLKLLLELKKDNIAKAKAHYNFNLTKNILFRWMWFTEDMWFDRNYKADDFQRKKILKKAFNALKKNHHEYILKKQVAEDYYDLFLTQLVFKKFREGIMILKNEFLFKYRKALLYCNSNLMFKTFTCWRTLPVLNALKKEKDARKLKWREKVLLVVPDYEPPED